MSRNIRTGRCAAALAGVLLTATACGSGGSASSAAPSAATTAPVRTATAAPMPTSATTTSAPVTVGDPCPYLTAAQVSSAVGRPFDAGVTHSSANGPSCHYPARGGDEYSGVVVDFSDTRPGDGVVAGLGTPIPGIGDRAQYVRVSHSVVFDKGTTSVHVIFATVLHLDDDRCRTAGTTLAQAVDARLH